MSIYFKHDAKRNFMFVVFHGEVSDHDLSTHINRMLEPEFDQEGKKGLIILCENMQASEMSFHGIFAAGKRMYGANFRKNGKLGMVANSAVAYGLAKTYQMAAEVAGLDEIRVMRDHALDDAMQWLGVSDMSNDIRLKISQMEAASSIEPVAMHHR